MKYLGLPIGAFILTAVGIGAVFDISKRPPALAPPLAVATVSAFADGGTVNIVLEDEVGRSVLIGLQGSLDVPPAEFPLVFQRWYGLFPIGRTVVPRSPDEATIVAALRLWLEELPKTAAYRDQLEHIEQIVGSRHPPSKSVGLQKNAA